MIQEVKTYVCDQTPKDDDIRQIIDIARRDHCCVKLIWYEEYSGRYEVVADEISTIEEVKEQMTKYYPV